MIRKTLGQPAQIQWHDIVPGRLLHVRVHGSFRPLDVLATYQYMDDNTASRRYLRADYWTKLDTTLHQLPNRNVLLFTGDLNCSLPKLHGLVGMEEFLWTQLRMKGRQHHDQGELVAVLKMHGLVALNTWSHNHGPTYVHGKTASRIDFAFTRQSHVDGLAKQPITACAAPFLGDGEYGHFPLIGSLPFFRIPQTRARRLGFSQRERNQCRDAWLAQDESWTYMLQSSQIALSQYATQSHPTTHTIQGLHDTLCPVLRTSLEPLKTHTHLSHTCPSQTQYIETKWHHLRTARTEIGDGSKPTLSAWFRCWFHLARHHALAKYHKTFATRIRRQKFQEIVNSAAKAADQHDSHRLFHIIHKFSPKTPMKRILIRNSQGAIAHPHEEKALFLKYIQDTWGDTVRDFHFPPTAPGIPFSEMDLAQALQKIPITKAVAKPCLPGILIRSLASQIAHYVYALLGTWWTQSPPFVPSEWRDSWLHFMAKPGKQPDRPQNLRAIALQEPIGKCITGLITKTALKQSFPTLCQWPQYAYLPFRCTADAIERVVRHCTYIRSLVQSQRSDVFNRAAKAPTYQACGGVQIYLDLTKAFDSVSRPVLFDNFDSCGISPDIQSLIMALHHDTHYHFLHDGKYVSVPVQKGVRQGCKLAPLLWACFMQRFLSSAATAVGLDWVYRHVTLYADDLHIGTCFHSTAEYWENIHHLGTILDIITDLGLTINVDKSHVLIKITGTNCRKLQKQVLHHHDAQTWIHIPRRHGFTAFRVEQSAMYLGVRMSYRNFEDLTIQARMNAGRTAFRRLRQWLTNRQFSIHHRIKLWRCCIQPIMTYGILTTGLTSNGLHKIQSLMYQMLRQTIGDHAYVTRRTHQEALYQVGCPTPLQLLLQVARTQIQSVTQRLSQVPQHDIIHQSVWQSLRQSEALILNELHQGPAVPVAPHHLEVPQTKPILQCAQCNFCTDNLSNLRRHCTNLHGQTRFRTFRIDWSQDAYMGMPQCSRCMTKFTSWRSFRAHVERRTCQALPTVETCAAPQALDTDVHTQQNLQPSVHRPEELQLQSATDSFEHKPSPVTPGQNHPTHIWLPASTDIHTFHDNDQLSSEAPASGEHLAPSSSEMSASNDDYTILRVRLLLGDLAHLNAQPFGESVLEHVRALDWQALARNQAACNHLTSHCVLCGVYTSRCQSLLAHLKLYHHDLLPNTLAKGAQLTLMNGKTSPCPFCQKKFTSGHMCPVLTQAALLLVNGAGTDVQQNLQYVKRVLHCEICHHDSPDLQDLYSHLHTAHKLAVQDWNASRDSQDGTPRCAHCGTQHPTMGALRRHITFGYCSQFDPFRSSETKTVDPDLVQALREGTLLSWLQPSLQRSSLTLSCCCCGEKYTRCGDLTAHLQLCHGHLWHAAIQHLALLTDFVLTSKGCICNPSVTTSLTSHVCAGLRQLAMQFQRIPDVLLVPYKFEEFTLRRLIHVNIHSDHYQRIVQCLLSRHFSQLWEDPDTVALLRLQCLFCGRRMHAADLCNHLFQEHSQLSSLTTHMTQQIQTILQDTLVHNHVCTLCEVAFDAPSAPQVADRLTAAQTHLRGLCPVVHQAALLLGHPPNAATQHGSGRADPAPGSLPRDEPTAPRQDPVPDPKSRPRQKAKRPEPPRGNTARGKRTKSSTSHHAHAAPDDNCHLATGQTDERAARAGFIRLFPQQRPDSSSSTAGAEGSRLECPEKIQPDSSDAPEANLVATSPDRAAEPGAEGPSIRASSGPQTGHDQTGLDAGGWHLALSPLVSGQTEAGDSRPVTSEPEENGAALHRHDRSSQSSRDCAEIPLTALLQREGHDDSMATEDQHAGHRAVSTSLGTVQQRSVEHPGGVHEETQPLTESDVPAPSTKPPAEGKGQREPEGTQQDQLNSLVTNAALQQSLIMQIYENTRNWCFANASVQALLWLLLSHPSFETSEWGVNCSAFLALLTTTAKHVKLTDFPWFCSLFHTWQSGERQQDASEFTAFLMKQMSVERLKHSWEKRYELNTLVQTMDHSSDFYPIVLQFPQHASICTQFCMQDLVDAWQNEHGMVKALTQSQDIICLHIDRFQKFPDGTLQKSLQTVSLQTRCLFPFFSDASIQVESCSYDVVSAIAHLGTQDSGHYRCLLRCRFEINAERQMAEWLLVDDNQPKSIVWQPPPWFTENVTVIWLCKTACVHLHPEIWRMASHCHIQDDMPDAYLAMFWAAPLPDDTVLERFWQKDHRAQFSERRDHCSQCRAGTTLNQREKGVWKKKKIHTYIYVFNRCMYFLWIKR